MVIRKRRWHSLILAVVLFFVTMAVTPVVATVVDSRALVQSQENGLQLAKQGKSLYQAGRFAEAADAWKGAVSAFAKKGDRTNQAMALGNLSLTYQQLGQWQAAKQAITTSLDLLKLETATSTPRRILAQTLDIQGKLQLATGQSTAALETWQQASKVYSEISDQAGLIQSQINSAQALQALGLYPRAKATLMSVKQKLQGQPDSSLKMTGLLSLGNALNVMGELNGAEEALQESLKIAKKLQPLQDQGAIFLSLGNVVRAKKDFEKAIYYYNQAESSASDAVQIQAQLNQLNLLVENKRGQDALSRWSPILERINKLPPSRSTIYAKINLAQSLICLKQPTLEKSEFNSPIVQQCADSSVEDNKKTTVNSSGKAIQTGNPDWTEIEKLLTTATQQANALEDKRAEAYALGYRGGMYQQARRWAEADAFTRKAVSLALAINAADVGYLWQWQLGRIARANADLQSAIAAYTVAFKTLQSLRGDLVATNPEIQYSFRDSVEPVYRELADLLLQPDSVSASVYGKGRNGRISQENVKQAREVIEALQLAELDNFFREACVDAKPQQIDQVVDQAKSPSAVFYAIFLKNRLEVILKLPEPNKPPEKQTLLYHSTLVSQETVESTLDQLQQYLRNPTRVNDIKKLSQQVYNWLIQPFEKDLQKSQIKTLVFVLDGSLRNIPMAVLYNGQEYLVEKYAIALTPGLQLLEPKPLAQVSLNALTAGISEAVPVKGIPKQFSELPYVEKELNGILDEVRGAELLNPEFTKSQLQNTLSKANFSVVHMATHGQFSSDLDNTYILAWKELIKVRDLENLLRIRESNRSIPIELLVLSACETATGDKRAALGLAGIAVRAGARSTLATLWQINDESTAEFMNEFYRQLKNNPNLTKAEVLQRTQLALWKIPGKRWERPYYWAAYVLVGNWL